jgi:hypothetical protein
MDARWQRGQSGNPAGRPRGAINRRNREILAEARERGIEPIQVMFDAMQHFLRRAEDATEDSEKDVMIVQAVEVASLAAPYCHPKLRQVEVTGPDGGPIQTLGLLAHLTNEELAERAQLKLGRPPLKLIAEPDTALIGCNGDSSHT